MRFVCDQDVDIAVCAVFRRFGHDAWSISETGLFKGKDDDLTCYAADHGAVLVTHDKEFSQRRKRNVVGKHLWLRCPDLEAADLVAARHEEIVTLLQSRVDIWVRVSADRIDTSSAWE